jgi:hypothetical protein
MSSFNIVEKIDSSLMHISNCLEEPEKLLSALESKTWKKDLGIDTTIGSFCMIREPEPEYDQIFDVMRKAAAVFLSNTDRDISDYAEKYTFHRVVRWEKESSTLVQHLDRWVTKGEQITPEITLVMYLTDDYEGGEVYFSSFDKKIKPSAGDILAFNSNTLHGTEPYLGGRRMTIQFFLCKKQPDNA